MQTRDAAVLSGSPSFNSGDLTEIAARVVEECAAEEKSDEFYDEFYFEREVDSESVKREGEEWGTGDHEDEGFEFEFVTRDSDSTPISADEIFHNGKIRPAYPFFNGDFFIRKVKMDANKEENGAKTIRLPLMKLLIEERETAATSSCSSSDVDELEGVPEEMYCVWQPKATSEAGEPEGLPEDLYCVWKPKPTPESPEETARRCKKSTSTGSIYKKLKLKELLSRSHSEGRKGNFVFLTPKNSWRKREKEDNVEETPVATGKLRPPPPRRTYLPYRQDLVGFFSGRNGLTKNLKPF